MNLPSELRPREQISQAGNMLYNASLIGLCSAVLAAVAVNLRFDDPRILHNAWTYFAVVPTGVVLLGLFSSLFANRWVERALQSAFLFSVTIHLLILLGSFHLVVLKFAHQATKDGEADGIIKRNEPQDYSTVSYEPQYDASSNESIANAITRSEFLDSKALETPLRHEQETEIDSVDKVELLPTKDLQLNERIETADIERQETPLDVAEIVSREQEIARQAYADSSDSLSNEYSSSEIEVPQQVEDPEGSAPTEATLQARNAPIDNGNLELLEPRARISPLRQTEQRLQPSANMPRLRNPSESSLSSDAVVNREQTQQGLRGSLENQLLQEQRFSKVMPRSNEIGETLSPSDLVFGQGRSASPAIGSEQGSSVDELPNTDVATMGLDRPRTSTFDSQSRSADGERQGSDTQGTGQGSGDGFSAVSGVITRNARNLGATPLGPRDTGMRQNPRSNLASNNTLGQSSLTNRLPSEIGTNRTQLLGRAENLSTGPALSTAVPAPAFAKRAERNSPTADASDLGQWGPQTEAAIESGLAFLAKHQREDGSWALEDFGDRPLFRSHTAATALALLAFQGAGYSHMEYQYQTQCAKAIEYLTARQQANGDLYIPMDEASDRNARFYSHGIAALALCEAYGMTQDERLRSAAQKSIDYLVQTQDPIGGGWRYVARTESDLSVSGWCMMAMKSAELAGLRVDDKAYRGVEKLLNEAQASPSQKHLYRYNPRAADLPTTRHGRVPTPTMTGVGLLLRLYTGWRRDNADMIRGADSLVETLPDLGTTDKPLRDTYYWYYATQVIFHMGGEHWQKWNMALHPMLIQSQAQRGRWEGSWNPGGPIPDRWGVFGGRLYVTTMNILSLEVYYRHLPIYEETAR